MPYMYVDIDLNEVDDQELIDELKSRHYKVLDESDNESITALEKIYHLRRQGKTFEKELDSYIMDTLGKVI